jgi:hypothetical protein
MQAILLGLGCDAQLYDRRLTRTNFGQRLNYYPPLRAEDEASGAGRLLGHEDVTSSRSCPRRGSKACRC